MQKKKMERCQKLANMQNLHTKFFLQLFLLHLFTAIPQTLKYATNADTKKKFYASSVWAMLLAPFVPILSHDASVTLPSSYIFAIKWEHMQQQHFRLILIRLMSMLKTHFNVIIWMVLCNNQWFQQKKIYKFSLLK